MNFVFTNTQIRIGRDTADKHVPKESTLVYRMLQQLNANEGFRPWVRFYPDRHGLTSSKLGIKNKRTGVIYWHANYQIEAAHEAFNKVGEVIFNKG